MKTCNLRRALSLLLVVAMVFSMLPTLVFAEDVPATHVVINQAYGGGGNSGAEYKNDYVELYNPTDEAVDLTGWSIQYASKTGTFGSNTLKLSGTIAAGGFYLIQCAAGNGGTKDLPTPDAVCSIAMAGKEFKLALVNGTEAVSGKDDAAVVDFLGVGAANEFEGTAAAPSLSNTTAACRNTDGVDTDDNAADFSAVAPNPRSSVSGEVNPPDPTDPVDPTDPSEPVVTVSPIADALAGETGAQFTVKGVVTLVDGKNLYVQDSTGAICLYCTSTPDVTLGDTVIGTGTRGEFRGMKQLSSATYVKDSGLALAPKETTISQLTDADVCSYVSIKGLTVTEVYDNDGQYASPNVTLTDGTASIQIYKAVVGKNDDGTWAVAVGDVLNVLAAVGTNNGTLQLRNTLNTEITKAETEPEPAYNTIAEALAASEGTFTVKGVVTLVDGKNIYVQDATGGICLYFGTAPTDIALGDTLIGTGTKAVYNSLPELTGATYEKSSGLTLNAKATTIDALTDADVCTYVSLTGLEITEVYDNSGKYASPNLTLSDGTNTIQIYKASVAKNEDGTWAWAVGDKVNVSAAVGTNKGTLQLRTTQTSEITAYEESLLTDGQKVVIYNPGSGKALSTTVLASYYLEGVSVTPNADGTVEADDAIIWTVGVNADGTYTFSTADGKKVTAGTRSSLPLDDENPNWTVEDAVTEGCVYIRNAGRPTQYIEWYAAKNEFSAYTYKAADETVYAMQLLKPVERVTGGLPADGEQVVIYNLSAKAVLAAENDTQSLDKALATLTEDGKADVANGGVVFTVGQVGSFYVFYNEEYGYLCSNGTGDNAFYQKFAEGESLDDACWTLKEGNGGYYMESYTAKFNGKYAQYLEYYADSFKTYSMNNVTDYDIYTFQFYPCVNETYHGIVNAPVAVFPETVVDAFVNQPYTITFTVDAVFGVAELNVTVNGTAVETTEQNDTYTLAIPADMVTGETLEIVVSGTDTVGAAITGSKTVTVLDEPVITNVTPAAGSATGENKRPVISAEVGNAGENLTVTLVVSGEEVEVVFENGVASYTPDADMADGRVSVTLTVTRADGKTASKSWSFTVGEVTEALYFGQLHSHTAYSDGSGSIDVALNYIGSLPEEANIDFVAFTDHSNYFDKSGAANPEGALYDMSLATEYSQGLWTEFNTKVGNFNASHSNVVALPGFEMTWSGGPGHINTWATPGIVSRNNTTLNNKTADAGMKAYYSLLSQPDGADSISQFNHPGSTFGTFTDFSYWDALIDTRMYLVEVGNGEGQIGAGGYYPSYEYYTMALDKGWHIAPTNNQDNHKGKWGNANDARDVVLTDDFSVEGIYAAIRQYKVYATEDKNLEILYTVNGLPLGSQITEAPDKLTLNVSVYDPDATDSISKVEVIVNSGKTVYTWDDPAVLASGELTCDLAPDYSYYYIRVTEGDGDLAVTAPVWVGETLKLGISSVACGTATPVTGEELTLTTTIFNSETAPATVKSVTYTTNGAEVLGVDTTAYTVPASGTLDVSFRFTPSVAKVHVVTVHVVMELDGKEYEFSMDITLDVLDADELVYIGIDASHYNEYVAGNYKDSMGNFADLAAGYSLRVVYLNTSEELITAANNADGKYKMIVMTAPSRRLAAAQTDPRSYSAEEIAALNGFNQNGGVIVMSGWSDYYENYSVITSNPDVKHMAAAQNEVLEALGSSLRIADDATHDASLNGGQTQRLYFSTYDFSSFLLDRVDFDPDHPNDNMYTERYSQYGGASIYVVGADGQPAAALSDTVTPIVYGHSTTYSLDSDKDGLGGDSVPKYHSSYPDDRLLVFASEELEGRGLIVVSGAAFMSNFEVQATISDSGSEKNYSNYKICENLCRYLNPAKLTPIAEVQAQTEVGFKYTIEGIVTSNASGYDKDTAFFDCIYVQDDSAGICCFPVAGNYKVGDVVRITGTTDFYQGEAELQVTDIELLGEGEPIVPAEVTASEINDGSVLGSLVTLKGTVVSFQYENELIQTIMVKDEEGNAARVFIDGYITTSKDVENIEVGGGITVTGLASYDNTFNAPEGPFPRIRIRNRADVVCTAAPEQPKFAFEDVPEGAWYYDAVYFAAENGLMEGTSKTTFSPNAVLTRAQIVTILYRMADEPAVSASVRFTDVKEGTWYTDAVIWAAQTGITNGVGGGKFNPNGEVTREQMVVFLARYAKYIGSFEPAEADLSAYPDAGTVHSWADESMQWAVANGIVNGDGKGLAPLRSAKRSEFAAILMRVMQAGILA